MNSMFSNKYTWVKYNPLQSLILDADWLLFGSPIEQLCEHIPLYKGEIVQKSESQAEPGECYLVVHSQDIFYIYYIPGINYSHQLQINGNIALVWAFSVWQLCYLLGMQK